MCGIWISSGGSHFEGSNFLWLPTVHWCIDVYCKDVTAGVCLHPPSNKNKNTHLHFWQSSLIHALQCPSVPFSARRNRLESGSWNTYLDLQCRHRGHLGRTECDAVFFLRGQLVVVCVCCKLNMNMRYGWVWNWKVEGIRRSWAPNLLLVFDVFFVQSAVHVMPMASSTPIWHRSRWLNIAGHQFANAWMYSNYMLSSNWRTWIEHAGFGKPIIELSGFVDHYCVSINADHMSMFRRYTTIFTSYCRC